MTAQTLIRTPTAEGLTERVDVIACLDESVRRKAITERPTGPGRYLEVQGPSETLLIPLGSGVMHIGRGLSADLHLDEKSVSRRHAMLVQRPVGRAAARRPQLQRHVRQRPAHRAGRPAQWRRALLGRVVLRYLEI